MPRRTSRLAYELTVQDPTSDTSDGQHSPRGAADELGVEDGDAQTSARRARSVSDDSGSGDDYEPPAADGGDDEDEEESVEEEGTGATGRVKGAEDEDGDVDDARGDEVFK